MPTNEFTAIVNIKKGKKKGLAKILGDIGNPLKVSNDYLQFAPGKEGQQARRTHFARMVIIPAKDDTTIYAGMELNEKEDAPETGRFRLVFSAIFDGDARNFIQEMVSFSPKLTEIWELCDDYDGGDVYEFLKRHRYRPQIFYTSFLKESVQSLTAKTLFRKDAQDALDKHLPDLDAARKAIDKLMPFENLPPANVARRAFLELAGAGILLFAAGAAVIALAFAINVLLGVAVILILGAVAAVILLPVLIHVILKRNGEIGVHGALEDEIDDYVSNKKAEKDHVTYKPAIRLRGREDVIVQNQFNLYLTFDGNVITRNIRLLRMMVLMFVLHRGLLIKPGNGSLAGLTTVHFGHWVLIDGGRRLFFMTNYDGSWENYIADFVNKIYPILDIQLWSFKGFDDEGTRNIAAFRRWLRRVQPQSDVFYSGYPQTTVRNISRDIEINDTFPSNRNDMPALHQWLKLLGDPTIKTEIKDEADQPYQARPQLEPRLTKEQWSDIQSIIVYGYANLPHGRYMFLHIDNTEKAKRWLKDLVPALTTVEVWENDDPARQLQTAVNIGLTYPAMEALNLPSETLDTFSSEYREGIAPDPTGSDNLHSRSINLGDTGDSEPGLWGVGNPKLKKDGDEIHVLLLLSGKTAATVDALLDTAPFNQIGKAASGLRVVITEQGTTPATGREPFGFRDGISNPWIEGTRYSQRDPNGKKGAPLKLTDTEIVKTEDDGLVRTIKIDHDPVVRTGEFILGYPNEYGQLPATPLVSKENDHSNRLKPAAHAEGNLTHYKDLGRNGSYLVYRKLKQDVEGLWDYLVNHTDMASDTPLHDNVLKRAAKMVGRWPSGTPLMISPDSDSAELTLKASTERNNSVYNNFCFRMDKDYDDSSGARCPFGSHIRRSHPRDGLIDDTAWQSIHNANLHRILRRSASFGRLPDHVVERDYYIRVGAPVKVTFSERPEHPVDQDGVGIHFLGVNASIQQQFEFIQMAWNNNNHFNGMFDSKDPLVGNNADAKPRSEQLAEADKYAEQAVVTARQQTSSMTIPKEPVREHLNELPRFVTVRGGAYLFLPSLSALRFIADRPNA